MKINNILIINYCYFDNNITTFFIKVINNFFDKIYKKLKYLIVENNIIDHKSLYGS